MSYKKAICSNCRNRYITEDKYCRFCGAPQGTPIFIDESFSCIYGPPYENTHKCNKCGYTWVNSGLGWDFQGWCPQCGGEAPALEEEKPQEKPKDKPQEKLQIKIISVPIDK